MALVRTYCISDETPPFPAHVVDVVVGVRGFQPTDGAPASKEALFWGQAGAYAFRAAGSYAIPPLIDSDRPPELVAILSNQRFALRASRVTSTPVASFYQATTAQVCSISRAAVEPWPGFEFLVGAPYKFKQGIVDQYVQAHRAIDLFDYLVLATELAVITPTEANQFARETELIPDGIELGVYPAAWLRSVLSKLESLGREFLRRFSSRLESYDAAQMRAIDFLSERLGSFLLLKELRARYPDGIPAEIFGSICILTPDAKA